MRPVELLGELTDHDGARRVGEAFELAQMLVEQLAGAGPLERRAYEERPLDGRRDGDQIACDWLSLLLTGRSAERVEPPGGPVWYGEAADHGSDDDVALDAVVHTTRVEQLPARGADPRIREVHRNRDDRRIVAVHREAVVDRAGRELYAVSDEHVVRQPRRVETIAVRVVDAEPHVEVPAGEPDAVDTNVPQLHHRLLERLPAERTASGHTHYRRRDRTEHQTTHVHTSVDGCWPVAPGAPSCARARSSSHQASRFAISFSKPNEPGA